MKRRCGSRATRVEDDQEKPKLEETMAWTAPKIEELACGMEINMYFPAEDGREGDLL